MELIRLVDWTTSDIPMSHSDYVDHIVQILEHFKERIPDLEKITFQPTPQKALSALWEAMMDHCCDCLVEGYAVDSVRRPRLSYVVF